MDHRRVKSKSDMSLCEKSMKIVVSVIRLSSFSIAQKSLGATTTTGKIRKDQLLSESDYSDISDPIKKEPNPLVADEFPAATSRSSRSQQPQSRANPTYVIKSSVGNNGSSTAYMNIHKERVHHHDDDDQIIHVNSKKEQCVDGLASDYIFKIRNKLGRAS